MYIRLDHRSGEPIYRQIVEAVKYKVAAGEVNDGGQLPSIRALADELKVNPRTVVKAYEELSHAGLVVMKQGQGVFVNKQPSVPAAARRSAIGDIAKRMLAEAARMGAGGQEVIDIVRDEAKRMERDK